VSGRACKKPLSFISHVYLGIGCQNYAAADRLDDEMLKNSKCITAVCLKVEIFPCGSAADDFVTF